MPDVYANILIGKNGVAFANHETTKRPVAIANGKLSAAWILQLIERANFYLDLRHSRATLPTSLSCRFEM